jgi:hypothetical protein
MTVNVELFCQGSFVYIFLGEFSEHLVSLFFGVSLF